MTDQRDAPTTIDDGAAGDRPTCASVASNRATGGLVASDPEVPPPHRPLRPDEPPTPILPDPGHPDPILPDPTPAPAPAPDPARPDPVLPDPAPDPGQPDPLVPDPTPGPEPMRPPPLTE